MMAFGERPIPTSLPLPTDARTLARLLRRAHLLLRRTESALGRSEEIHRLAERRRELEVLVLQTAEPIDARGEAERERARLAARLERLTRPIHRLHDDLAAFRGELACALAGLPGEDARYANLRARVEALRWPSAPGFRQPLLEPARNNLREIVVALSEMTKAGSAGGGKKGGGCGGAPPGAQPAGGEEVLTLAEAAGYLKVNYQRAAELVRRQLVPAFHLGRQVRIRRRDLEEFMQRGGQGR